MERILRLAKNYSKENHSAYLSCFDTIFLDNFNFIYDEKWEKNLVSCPYEILTYLLDCYYVLPERPDLATLFCWQAINHSYYVQQLIDNGIEHCQDTIGIELIKNTISEKWNEKYKLILEPFLERLPDKTFRFVASYLLKGYALEKKRNLEKYISSSYKSLKKRIPKLSSILNNSYGEKYYKITDPHPNEDSGIISFGIKDENKKMSRSLTHSFAIKLKRLVLGDEIEITFCDEQRTKKNYQLTDEEIISFVLFGILYASRCNNFHGNVAVRMNSINANKDTFRMYTDIFLLEYIILALYMNESGKLSDSVVEKIKNNYNLMI